jgi:hypothetical protein
MTKAQRIDALIAAGRFVKKDSAWLEHVPDERLTELLHETATAPAPVSAPPAPPAVAAAPAQAPAQAPVPVAAPVAPVAQPVAASARTVEQVFAEVGDPVVREELKAAHTAMVAARTAKITALKATNRCKFSDEELGNFSAAQLDRLLELSAVPAPVPSYAGASGVPVVAASDDSIPEARSITEAFPRSA